MKRLQVSWFTMPDKHNQQQTLIKLANYRMPFGKYANRLLVEIPERYYIWFANKGFPEGELGKFMRMMLEIKTNGLEYLLTPLRNE